MRLRYVQIKDGNGKVYDYLIPPTTSVAAFVGYTRSLLKKVEKAPAPLTIERNEIVHVALQ